MAAICTVSPLDNNNFIYPTYSNAKPHDIFSTGNMFMEPTALVSCGSLHNRTEVSLPSSLATSTETLGPSSIPTLTSNEESSTVYHSMANAEVLPLSLSRTLDPLTMRRLMTPLYVDTSCGNRHTPVYPKLHGFNVGGLLKIATTEVYQPLPRSKQNLEIRQNQVASWRNIEHQMSSIQTLPNKTPSESHQFTYPSLAITPMNGGIISGVKRSVAAEPALNDEMPLKKRKLRSTFSKEQVDTMEAHFRVNMYLTLPTRRQLAQQLWLDDSQVKTWFQNRRMRWKRQHLEKQTALPRYHQQPSTLHEDHPETINPLCCPPAAQHGQFAVPTTPPPSVNTTSAVVAGLGLPRNANGLVEPHMYPVMPPPQLPGLCSQGTGATPGTVLQENCCPVQAIFRPPPSYPYFHVGFGMPHWISTNITGVHSGALFPTRHM